MELFRRIIALTPAKKDQDHLRIVIDNNPQIPDRTAAILGKGESPLSLLIETARNLERAGADLIAIPCNTAHFYLSEVQKAVKVPIIDMIGETVSRVEAGRVGLLATDGTRKSGVYSRACAARGIDIVYPSASDQKWLMEGIYAIKSGAAPDKFQEGIIGVIERIKDAGAGAAILGCTELSLIPVPDATLIPVYDALTVLAQVAVSRAMNSG